MNTRLTVIVAHRNDPHLETTLQMLMKQNTGLAHNIIVVDDCSDEKYMPDPVYLETNGIRLIRLSHQHGCGGARNHGVALTDAPVIAFCDSDLEPGPGWMREGYDAVSPLVLVTGPVPKRHRNKRPSLAERYNSIESPHSTGARTYGTGNVMLLRKDFIGAGCFNSQITRGHDMDFFSRWTGRIKMAPGMMASHPSKNHREKVQTIHELVKDWKKLGHRPSFVRRLAPDRNLLKNVMQADISALEKMMMLGYHFILKGYYLYYWLRTKRDNDDTD